MRVLKILTSVFLALFTLICGAAVDEKKILQLAKLDARAYCLSYLPKCDYQIQSLGKPNGSNAAWWVSVSHIVMADKWRLFAPGSTTLDITYDENGEVISENKNQLPSRTASTGEIGFLVFCQDGLDRMKAPWNEITRSKICGCAAEEALTHKWVANSFEMRREDWPDEMISPEAKTVIGDILAKSMEACVGKVLSIESKQK